MASGEGTSADTSSVRHRRMPEINDRYLDMSFSYALPASTAAPASLVSSTCTKRSGTLDARSRIQAAPIIMRMPRALTVSCSQTPLVYCVRIQCAENDRNAPRQKIGSECWPQRMTGWSHLVERPPVVRDDGSDDGCERKETGQAQHVEVGLVDRIADLDHPVRHERHT